MNKEKSPYFDRRKREEYGRGSQYYHHGRNKDEDLHKRHSDQNEQSRKRENYHKYNPQRIYSQSKNFQGRNEGQRRSKNKKSFVKKEGNKDDKIVVTQHQITKSISKSRDDTTPKKRKSDSLKIDPTTPKKRKKEKDDITEDEEEDNSSKEEDTDLDKSSSPIENVVEIDEIKGRKIDEIKECDIDENDVGEGGRKDSVIATLKAKINEKDKELASIRKKASTKNKTMEILGNLDAKNKVLEQEKYKLEGKIKKINEKHANEIKVKEEEMNAIKDNLEKVANVDKERDLKEEDQNKENLRKTLKRIRDERKSLINSNEVFKKELKSKKAIIAGHEISKEIIEKEIDSKDKELEVAEGKIQILNKLVKSFEEENSKLKKAFEAAEKFKEDVENTVTEDNDEVHIMPNQVQESIVADHTDNQSIQDGRGEHSDDKSLRGEGRERFSESEEDSTKGSQVDHYKSNEEESEAEEEESGGNCEDGPDSSNDDEEENKLYANQTFIVDPVDESNSIENIILDSEEEFADETFYIGKTIVNNYYNSKETVIDYTKIPEGLFQEGSKFQASPTALNNKIVFIACNNNVAEHSTDNEGRKKFCELSPVCKLSWKNGDPITKVFIIGNDHHPKNNDSVWACRHHAEASIRGIILQTQRYDHNAAAKESKEVVNKVEVDSSKGKIDEVSEEKGKIKEADRASDEKAPKPKVVRKMSLKKNKKNKTTPEGTEELITMYDRVKRNSKNK